MVSIPLIVLALAFVLFGCGILYFLIPWGTIYDAMHGKWKVLGGCLVFLAIAGSIYVVADFAISKTTYGKVHKHLQELKRLEPFTADERPAFYAEADKLVELGYFFKRQYTVPQNHGSFLINRQVGFSASDFGEFDDPTRLRSAYGIVDASFDGPTMTVQVYDLVRLEEQYDETFARIIEMCKQREEQDRIRRGLQGEPEKRSEDETTELYLERN